MASQFELRQYVDSIDGCVTDDDVDVKKEAAKDIYLEACRRFDTVPSRHFIAHCNEPILTLKNNGLGPKGVQALAEALIQNVEITQLNLQNNFIDNQAGQAIGEVLKQNQTITILNLAENKIAHGAQAIAESLIGNKTMASICLSGNTSIIHHPIVIKHVDNELSDNEAVAFATMLKTNRTLVHLDLSNNKITDYGAAALGQAIATNDMIKEVNLSWNHLRPRGVQLIMTGIRDNPSVTWLHLGWNSITDPIAQFTGQVLSKNSFLNYLNLRYASTKIVHMK